MIEKPDGNFIYIDSDSELQRLCDELHDARVIALDTEFMREKTYYARLCLIQIATSTHIACIDPLKISNLKPLQELLNDSTKLKLLHAARQDLEIFYDLWNQVPQPVFDTQIAAALLGYNDQIGYASLIESLLSIKLDKSPSRTDWSQRPLSDSQLSYAADDVRYLLQCYPIICAKLNKLKRLEWLDEDFTDLINPALYAKDIQSSWKRVSGHGKLKPAQLAILQALAAWRETHARERDKPRKWILADDMLVLLARQAPSSIDALSRIRGFPEKLLKRSAMEILSIIESTRSLPAEELPPATQFHRLSIKQECLADTLMAYLKVIAMENQINAAVMATRKDIEKLVRGDRKTSVLHGWRRHIAGQPLLDFIDGRITLRVENGKVIAESEETD